MSQGFLPAARFAQRNVHKWVYELRQQPLADGEVIQRPQMAHVMIPAHRLDIALVQQIAAPFQRHMRRDFGGQYVAPVGELLYRRAITILGRRSQQAGKKVLLQEFFKGHGHSLLHSARDAGY